MISLNSPAFGNDVEELVLRVLRSGHLAQGPMVERFEAACADMAGTSHAVAMSNGTVTLEASLEILGVGPGDEVITSPLTFAATLNSILRTGATARFVDIDATGTLDPRAVASAVGPRTRALVPVHLYGLPADMPALADIAERNRVDVVEDAAQAHGASCAGRRVGSYGLGSFSFYATKNISAGEGGVVTTDHADQARRLRLLRNQGMVERYHYEMVGRNLRMTDLQAAVAIPALEKLDEINTVRRSNAGLLSSLLAGTDLELPRVPADREHVWHLYTILLPGGHDREVFVTSMERSAVQAGVFYPHLVWDYDAYRGSAEIEEGDTPTAADWARRCVSLPVHHRLSHDDVERVAEAARAAQTASAP